MHLWTLSCYFDIVCLTTQIDVFQNDRNGMQKRAINQNGLKRHQAQLKRTVTVPKRSPLLLLTPLRSLSKQFITSHTHSVSFSRDGRVCCVVAASLCVGERTVQDGASAKRHKNRCRSRGRGLPSGGERRGRGPCVAWVRPFVSPRAWLCSSSRRHFRPARSFFFF